MAPQREPGLAYALQRDHFDRVDAVSFTLEHDDGAGLDTLAKADVVLVGVSRVSKSVTCFYLGYRGIRAANVPLIPNHKPPEQLVAMPAERVIALTVNANRLQSLRDARQQAMGAGELGSYVDARAIRDELRFAERLAKKHHWRLIDVSYMAVEEVAREVLGLIGR
jgi:regulator of PEP synthase PpsR (kinase-PPPase family)